jgi:hypothetical protein
LKLNTSNKKKYLISTREITPSTDVDS